MIASFSREFIFIRTRKTASTSVEIVLGSWCNSGDIITPIGVDDELTRLFYGGGPRNFCTDSNLELRYRETIQTRKRSAISAVYREIMKNLDFSHHMPASELRLRLPPDFWAGAHKFAVDRHPYEKAVSMAYWRHRKALKNGAELEDFLDVVIDKGEYRNFDLYSINGEVAVNCVFRFERLWHEVSVLANRLGVVLPSKLPNAKSQYRRHRRPASDFLTRRQKRRIYEICAEEFRLLGYAP